MSVPAKHASVPVFHHQLRVGVAALLLAAQALGFAHVAAAEHTMTDVGTVAERLPRAAEAHDDTNSHLCAGDAFFHEEGSEDCMVVAALSAPSVIVPRADGLTLSMRTFRMKALRASFESAPFDVLSRAPKASPPES